MGKHPSDPQIARRRAELIMKVRCNLMTASEAARQLGVSRKTYYQWEQRGLSGFLEGLTNQDAGRPSQPVDPCRQELETQVHHLQQENELLTKKMALKDVLTDLKLAPGGNRAKKK
jgi:transposase